MTGIYWQLWLVLSSMITVVFPVLILIIWKRKNFVRSSPLKTWTQKKKVSKRCISLFKFKKLIKSKKLNRYSCRLHKNYITEAELSWSKWASCYFFKVSNGNIGTMFFKKSTRKKSLTPFDVFIVNFEQI